MGITGFVMLLAWMSSVTAGHTKRITTNTIMLCAYCIGNAVGPQMWKEQYKPRYHVPWSIISACYIALPAIMFLLRWMLKRENARRDAEPRDTTYDNIYIRRTDDEGKTIEVKVAKVYILVSRICFVSTNHGNSIFRNSLTSRIVKIEILDTFIERKV
jgi:MFS transporter, ACS family, allantoate permease